MNIKEVKDLIHEVLQSDINEFELEHTGTRIRLKRGFGVESAVTLPPSPHPISARVSTQPAAVPESVAPPVENAENAEDNNLHIITSPIVGTVYHAPSPGSDPYIQMGDHVQEGSVLCLVEAMKLMNEILSDMEGEVVRIYIENGTPVEFGQKLFAIRPSRQG
jgi:acetyl-CoA carboxylase biotin carboxyl carrier protein